MNSVCLSVCLPHIPATQEILIEHTAVTDGAGSVGGVAYIEKLADASMQLNYII